MRNPYNTPKLPFHADDCRFTDRKLEVFTHGHGIKLSIRHSPVKGDVVSVFLDAGQLQDLAASLGSLSGHESPSRIDSAVSDALSALSSALNRAGF
jgi:hypothetical protein